MAFGRKLPFKGKWSRQPSDRSPEQEHEGGAPPEQDPEEGEGQHDGGEEVQPASPPKDTTYGKNRPGFMGRHLRKLKGAKAGEAAPVGDTAATETADSTGKDLEGQVGADEFGSGMTVVTAGEKLEYDAAKERKQFLQFPRNAFGGVTRTDDRASAARRDTYKEEELGLMREARPHICEDVVNKMEQRLTLFQQANVNNVIPRKAEKEGDGNPTGSKPLGLGPIPEGDSGAEQPSSTKEKGKPNIYLDNDGLMISLPDPIKRYHERPSWRFDIDAPYLENRVIVPSVGISSVMEKGDLYTLDVEVTHLRITADPMMAREEYLMAELFRMMQNYERRQRAGLADLYAAKLAALEETLLVAREELFAAQERRDLRATSTTADPSPSDDLEEIQALVKNCAKFERQVAEIRRLKEEEEEKMADAAEDMAKLYFKIKALREKQRYWLTEQRLEMKMAPSKEMTAEFQNRKSRRQLDVELLLAEEDDIAELPKPPERFEQEDDDDSGFQLRRVESTCAAHSREVLQLQESRTQETDSAKLQDIEDRLAKLGPAPRRIPRSEREEKRARRKAREKMEKGELGVKRIPTTIPTLVDDSERAKEGQGLDEGELSRRERVSKQGYYVKLLINGNYYAGKTSVCRLRGDFTLDFNEVLRVKLRRWPEKAVLQLWRKGLVRDAFVSDVPFTIPGAGVDAAPKDYVPVQYEWESLDYFDPNWSPPGPEEQLTSPIKAPIPESNISRRGSLWVRCSWVAQEEEDPTMLSFTNPLAAGAGGQESRAIMPPPPAAERLALSELDPNDPRNAWYPELLKINEAHAAAMDGGLTDCFRLKDAGVELKAAPDVDNRANFLPVRWKQGPTYGRYVVQHETKMTWSERQKAAEDETMKRRRIDKLNFDSEEEVQFAIEQLTTLKDYGLDDDPRSSSRLSVPASRRHGAVDTSLALKKMEERDRRIREFLQDIKKRVTSRAKAARRVRTIKTEDVVIDVQLPEFNAGFSLDLSSFFQPVRRFGPVKQKAMAALPHSKTTNLTVTVIKAINLPRRFPSKGTRPRPLHDGNNKKDSPPGEGDKNAPQPCFPFVEVRCGDQQRHTSSSQSSATSCVWNSTLTLPYHPPPCSMWECRDEIAVSVYDEVIFRNDEAAPGDTETLTRRLLGTLRLSAGAVYRAAEISGTFDLEVPPILAGYNPASRNTSLQLAVKFNPPLAKMPHTPEEHSEEDDIARHANQWVKKLYELKQCQPRVIKAMALDEQCKPALLCRFLGKSFTLPDRYKPQDSSIAANMRRVARLVSLIPLVHDSDRQHNRQGVWISCAKIHELALGTYREHAALLAGYFKALGVKSYVVLGTSLSDAEAAWVLTVGTKIAQDTEGSSSGRQLWDPVSGRCYEVSDPACQMRVVGVVFDDVNIWANIQQEGQPLALRWDLSDTTAWRPFFGPAFPLREVATLQKDIKVHRDLGTDFNAGLGELVEKRAFQILCELRNNDERNRSTERVDGKLVSRIRDLLKTELGSKLEEFCEAPTDASDNSQAKLCQSLTSMHKDEVSKVSKDEVSKVSQDFVPHIFCLPIPARGNVSEEEKFNAELKSELQRVGLEEMPGERKDKAEWKFLVVGQAFSKAIPYVSAIWIYVAALLVKAPKKNRG